MVERLYLPAAKPAAHCGKAVRRDRRCGSDDRSKEAGVLGQGAFEGR